MYIRGTILVALGLIPALTGAQNSSAEPSDTKTAPASLLSALDTNSNGILEATEIAHAAASLKRQDQNNDGILSSEELQSPPGIRRSGSQKKASAMLLAALDLNHDGQLDASEIASAKSSLLTLDVNYDEKLSKNELKGPEDRSPEPDRGEGSPNDHTPKPGENKTPH